MLFRSEIDLNDFYIIENKEMYEFRAKENYFNPKNIATFLETQYVLCKSERTEEIVNVIRHLKNYDDIIGLAGSKMYTNFQEINSYYKIKCGKFKSVNVDCYGIAYFFDGKAYLECYKDLFDYIKNLVISTDNTGVSQYFRIFLE